MSWPDGAHDIQHSLRHKRHENGAQRCPRLSESTIGLCPSVAKNDECREGVRGDVLDGG